MIRHQLQERAQVAVVVRADVPEAALGTVVEDFRRRARWVGVVRRALPVVPVRVRDLVRPLHREVYTVALHCDSASRARRGHCARGVHAVVGRDEQVHVVGAHAVHRPLVRAVLHVGRPLVHQAAVDQRGDLVLGGQRVHRHPAPRRERVVVRRVARQLVADGRHAKRPHAHLAEIVAVAVGGVEVVVLVAVAVHVAALAGLHRHAHVAVLDHAAHLVGHALAHDHVAVVDVRVHRHEAVGVQLAVVGRLDLAGALRDRVREELLFAGGVVLLVLLLVRAEERAVEHAAVQRAAVHDDGVLLVEARVGADGHDDVGAVG